MDIRFFRDEDYAGVSELLNSVYRTAPPMTSSRLRSEFEHRGDLSELSVVLETPPGEIVGFCGYSPLPEGRALLDGPVVKEAYRGKGWGQKLFEQIAGLLLARGLPTVSVVVGEDNTQARSFLSRLGFQEEKTDLIVVCEEPVHPRVEPPVGIAITKEQPELDLEEYENFHAQLFERRSLAYLGVLVRSPSYSIYAAREGRTLVGFLELEYLDEVATIEGFGVSPEHRRRGIGRALLARALDDAWATEGVRRVRQIWKSSDKGFVRVYLDLGFVQKYSICGMIRQLGPARA
ncbi:MAG: GNAT family N-acetyltransferase [Armatimonadetes bacterium]|nr:GNAT family N-acetyltransferase [Armatimonadota bacterium]